MYKLLFCSVFLLLIPSLALAGDLSFGLGASAGFNIPVAQQDQKSGSTFGFRGIVKALPVVVLEPNLAFSRYGDPDLDLEGVTSDLEGSKVTSFGIDATVGAPMGGPGIRPFALLGLGFYKASRDQVGNFEEGDTQFGWAFGLGSTIAVNPHLAVDVRGKFNMISAEGSSSKKSVFVTAGLNYYFGGK
jgi:opacity protein-like surface antigen